MFTIEVKKKAEDEEFSFKDIEMFHQECMGGKIEITKSDLSSDMGGHNLTCKRCGTQKEIEIGDETINIIKTVIDGQERKIELSEASYVNIPDNIIKVVQKN